MLVVCGRKGFVSTCRPPPHTPVCLRQGFVMRLADGRLVFFVPVPAAYIADLPEAANVLNVLCYPAKFSDPNYLVPKEELNSVRGVFAERTEEYHNQASQHRASSIRRLGSLSVVLCSWSKPTHAAQVIDEAEQLQRQGASKATVEKKLKEAGLRSTDKVLAVAPLHVCPPSIQNPVPCGGEPRVQRGLISVPCATCRAPCQGLPGSTSSASSTRRPSTRITKASAGAWSIACGTCSCLQTSSASTARCC